MIDDPLHTAIIVDQLLEDAENKDRIDALEQENAQLKQKISKLEGKLPKEIKAKRTHSSRAKTSWWIYIIFSGIIPLLVSIGLLIYVLTKY